MSTHVQLFWTQLNRMWSRRTRKPTGARQNQRANGSKAWGIPAQIELLDQRTLLSATAALNSMIAVPTIEVDKSSAVTGASGYTPSQLQTAYGFNSLSLNGTGQTIAIVDAYNDPTIQADLQAFDRAFGLANPPSLTVMSQTGSTTSLPQSDPSRDKQDDWEVEESLDVEWAHALAPGAKIVLVEANSDNLSDLIAATKTAANLSGVSVVSMSWGGDEFSTEASDDSDFMTPSGHQGVTFVASTGDDGEPGGYPAYSPNVLAVGGTTLTIGASGNYVSESGWSDSGGGVSQYEPQPSYQSGVVTQSTTKRANPDVAFDADPNTGVPVYDSFSNGTTNPWAEIGGTSLAAPSWAAVISIVDQGRAANGLGTLNGATQTLPMLYQLHQTDPAAFHDITTGNNGFPASTGYDLVTGLGSPVVNVLVPALSGGSNTTSTASKLAFQQSPTTGTAGQALGTSVTVAIENSSGQVVTNNNSVVTLSIGSGPGGFTSGGSVSVTAVNGIATFNNLTLDVAGKYTLGAGDSGLTGATSNVLTINAAQASKIAFQQLPTTGTIGHALNPGVMVAVEDPFGNVVTSNSSTVTVSVSSGPGSFASGSTTSVTTVSGVVTFSNLVLATAGNYTISAKDSSLPSITSGSISVSGGLAAPQNVSLVAVNSTTAQLSWGAVTGAQGYRVFLVNGSQSSLESTVTSSTTSVQLSGLTAGSTASYKVEAYSGTTIADSQVVTVTLPTAQVGKLTLNAEVVSQTSVELNWTPVSGAQGYNVYYSDGTTQRFLGSVGAGTTSTRVYDLQRFASYEFQVEAYHGTSVQYSNWVWVNAAEDSVHSAAATVVDIPVNAIPDSIRRPRRG